MTLGLCHALHVVEARVPDLAGSIQQHCWAWQKCISMLMPSAADQAAGLPQWDST